MADSDKLGSPQFNTSQPDHLADPRGGDDHLRDVKQRVYNWGTREHNVDGKHKVPIGAGTPTADATAYGQLAVKTGDGGYNELWCNVTGAFERLTSRGSVATLQTAVTVTLPAVDAGLQAQIDAAEIATLDLAAIVAGLGQKIVAQTPIVYTSDGSFSDPDAIFVLVEAWGGGGGGGQGTGGNDTGASGGSAGAYAASLILASSLGTVIVDVAASVAAGVNGNPSSFGTYVVAGGGRAGSVGSTPAGGAASFGVNALVLSQVGVNGGAGGAGVDYGGGNNAGGGGGGCAGTAGQNGIGGGGPRANGGTGAHEGGDGGKGGYNNTPGIGDGLPGVSPGGGGGGSGGNDPPTVNGGTGAEGRVRVTVYK